MVMLHIKSWLANVLSSLMCFPLVFSLIDRRVRMHGTVHSVYYAVTCCYMLLEICICLPLESVQLNSVAWHICQFTTDAMNRSLVRTNSDGGNSQE